MPKCLSCVRGFTNECRGGDCDTKTGVVSPEIIDDERSSDEGSVRSTTRTARRTKPDAALKDQQSTGRKRAARLYPLHPDEPCEWRGKQNCGGGDFPIQGCDSGMQLNRHHGPDKNTLNNEPGNVHRICAHCHNRWHSKNDPDYDPNRPLKD